MVHGVEKINISVKTYLGQQQQQTSKQAHCIFLALGISSPVRFRSSQVAGKKGPWNSRMNDLDRDFKHKKSAVHILLSSILYSKSKVSDIV